MDENIKLGKYILERHTKQVSLARKKDCGYSGQIGQMCRGLSRDCNRCSGNEMIEPLSAKKDGWMFQHLSTCQMACVAVLPCEGVALN